MYTFSLDQILLGTLGQNKAICLPYIIKNFHFSEEICRLK